VSAGIGHFLGVFGRRSWIFSGWHMGCLLTGHMKDNGSEPHAGTPTERQPTLADLIATVSQITQNERLSALIVADMINRKQVRLEGEFRGRRVIVN
jgi:hypothetical protein